MEARQAIAAGDVIFTDKVQAPMLVKRGELIKVVAQGGGIRVSTTARGRQDGARGELVQLESLETREIYDARVTGFREAAVFTASSVALQARNIHHEQLRFRLHRQSQSELKRLAGNDREIEEVSRKGAKAQRNHNP